MNKKIYLIIVVIIASFLSAFIGQLVVNNLSEKPSLGFDDNFIIRQTPDHRVLLQKAAVDILQTEIAGIVEIYGAEWKLLGSGHVVTNDGWLVAVDFNKTSLKWKSIRLESGKIIEITEMINDPASDLVFVKVDSQNLSPVTLGDSIKVTPLQTYILIDYRGLFNTTEVIGETINPADVLSSDKLNSFVLFTTGQVGQSVYNEEAEMVGLIVSRDEQGRALAINASFIRDTLQNFLRKGVIERAQLGVNYVDLAHKIVKGNLVENTAGALVVSLLKPEINSKNSVFTKKIRENDIIISINGLIINSHQSLSDHILSLKTGDKIELGIIRKSEPITLGITLN